MSFPVYGSIGGFILPLAIPLLLFGPVKIYAQICFTYSLALLSPLFPGVPEPSVVIYVVKNASRPVSGELSSVPDGKRFSSLLVAL